MKITTKKCIEVSDWDNLVKETYGRPYSFQQQDGCRDRGVFTITVPEKSDDCYTNDTIPEVVNGNEIGVSFAAWLARNPKKKLPNKDDQNKFSLELFWERSFYPDIQMVANDLHKKGLLEAGDYTLEIDW